MTIRQARNGIIFAACLGALTAGVLFSGCAVAPPPAVTPDTAPPIAVVRMAVTVLDAQRQPVPGLRCDLLLDDGSRFTCAYNGVQAVFQLPSDRLAWGGQLHLEADGFKAHSDRVVTAADVAEVLLTPVAAARTGQVAIAGRTFVDAGGPWLAVGASHFSSLWLYQHDPAKFGRELMTLREPGVIDWLRSFVLVGPAGRWEDRQLGPDDIDAVGAVTDAHYAAGFRTQWTVFAGIDRTPTAASRVEALDRVCAQLRPRLEKVQFVEIANEGWQNGFGGEEGRQELRRLVARLRGCLPGVQVAPTAPEGSVLGSLYDGSAATLATAHLERDINGTGGPFRPIRQSRELAEQGWPWISNEPIGPQSSGAADDDPTRLMLSAVYTWLSGGAGYVYHTGAGIRSGGVADAERGRAGQFSDVSRFAQTLARIQAARTVLPADLPNWRWQNSNDRYPQYPFRLPYTSSEGTKLVASEEQLLRAFAALAGDGRFVVVPLRVEAPTAFVAARPMTFDVHPADDPTSTIAAVTLAPGDSYTLPAMPGAFFIGRFL